MSKTEKNDIPYFLTKEYGDRQRKKKRRLIIITVICLGILAVKAILF